MGEWSLWGRGEETCRSKLEEVDKSVNGGDGGQPSALFFLHLTDSAKKVNS